MIQNLEILYLIIIKVNTVRRTHILKEFRWINNNIGIYFVCLKRRNCAVTAEGEPRAARFHNNGP